MVLKSCEKYGIFLANIVVLDQTALSEEAIIVVLDLIMGCILFAILIA